MEPFVIATDPEAPLPALALAGIPTVPAVVHKWQWQGIPGQSVTKLDLFPTQEHPRNLAPVCTVYSGVFERSPSPVCGHSQSISSCRGNLTPIDIYAILQASSPDNIIEYICVL